MPRGIKKIKIPQIDLAKYSNSENIPLRIEKIILEALIVFKMDIKKVSEYFNISEDIVNEVAIEYYTNLTAIYNNQIQTKILDETLNDASSILNQHVSEIKKAQKNSSSKTLRQQDLNGLCKTIDRISLVRSEATKAYDTTVNKLINNITNIKLAEAKISGPLDDNSDYLENQTTVFDMLNDFRDISSSNKKAVIVIEKDTNNITEFDSISNAAHFLKSTAFYIKKKIDDKTLYKNKYYIKLKEE